MRYTACYNPNEVLNWRLYGQTLQEVLVDNTKTDACNKLGLADVPEADVVEVDLKRVPVTADMVFMYTFSEVLGWTLLGGQTLEERLIADAWRRFHENWSLMYAPKYGDIPAFAEGAATVEVINGVANVKCALHFVATTPQEEVSA